MSIYSSDITLNSTMPISEDILSAIQNILEYGILNYPRDTYELVITEAANTAYQQIYSRTLRQLSIPLTPEGNNKVPEAAVAATPVILGYHDRVSSRLTRESRVEINKMAHKYGPAVANLASDVKQSNSQFLQAVSEISEHFGEVRYTGLYRYDTLLNKAANNPAALLYQRLVNVPNTYGILAGSRSLRTYAINALTKQQEQVSQLTQSQTAEQIVKETLTIVRELETSLKTEQTLKNIAGKVLSLVWSIVRGILGVIWKVLRPILSMLWRIIGPSLPVLEKLTAVAVKITGPLRASYTLLNNIPGFSYLRYGLLIGLPLASSLIPGLGHLGFIVDQFKTSMIAVLQGSATLIDASIKEFVQAHSSNIFTSVLGTVSPVVAQVLHFVLGTWIPFLFGFGVNNFIFVFLILLLPLIHKAIVFLRQFEQMRKELSDVVIEDMEQEKKRIQRSVTIVRG